jgi:hypothetical protein
VLYDHVYFTFQSSDGCKIAVSLEHQGLSAAPARVQPRALHQPPPAVKTRKQRQLGIGDATHAGSAEAGSDLSKQLSALLTNHDREVFLHSIVTELDTYYAKEIQHEATWPAQAHDGSSFIRKN